MYPKEKVLDQDIMEIYNGDVHVLTATGKEMKSMTPNWTGCISVGDIITVNDSKKRIIQLTTSIPNPGETVTKYKVVFGDKKS